MRGSIIKRGPRSWAVVIPMGQTRKWFSHRTRGAAEAHLAQILSQVQAGTWTPPTKVLLGDYLKKWLQDYAVGAVAATTQPGYRMIIRRHIVPALGYVPLTRLAPQALQGYYSQKLADGLSGATVRQHHAILHKALRHAVRWGLLGRNPADLVDPPRAGTFDARVWDEEQTHLFLGEARKTSPYYALYLTAILSGMRQSELLGLRWSDVDLGLGVAKVVQSFHRVAGNKKDGRAPQALFKAPKSESSRRAVALPPAVIDELRRIRAEQEEVKPMLGDRYCDHDLIFCQPDGKPEHAHNIVARDFHPTCERAKVPRVRFHDLRHLHASHLARAGVPIKVVQERLGHASPAFTMRVYQHVFAGQQDEAARMLQGKLLGGPAILESASRP